MNMDRNKSHRGGGRSDREQWLNFNLCQSLLPSCLSIHLCVYGLLSSASSTFEGTQTRRPQLYVPFGYKRQHSFRFSLCLSFPHQNDNAVHCTNSTLQVIHEARVELQAERNTKIDRETRRHEICINIALSGRTSTHSKTE